VCWHGCRFVDDMNCALHTIVLACCAAWSAAAVASPTNATPSTRFATTPPPVVVLHPGILGFRRLPLLGDYWGDLPARLREQGMTVVERAPGPVEPPIVRARALAADVAAIRAETGVERVVIVAHSQGGLDVRAAIDGIDGFAEQVGAVATLSTPHHGTPMADFAFLLPAALVNDVFDALHWTFESSQHIGPRTADTPHTLQALSRSGGEQYMRAHPTSAVPFFSIAAVTGDDVDDVCSSGIWGAPVVQDFAGPLSWWNRAAIAYTAGSISNDGVVPTASMRFGTFLGCVPADHGDWMGWTSHPLEEELVWASTSFLVELVSTLVDVDRYGERAMPAHLGALATLARSSTALTTSGAAPRRNPVIAGAPAAVRADVGAADGTARQRN
jgi:triacylglycerol lipase